MPVDMSLYPEDWPQIRHQILLRAGGEEQDPRIGARCESCGVLNYAVGYRNAAGAFHYAAGNIYYDAFQYAGSQGEWRLLSIGARILLKTLTTGLPDDIIGA